MKVKLEKIPSLSGNNMTTYCVVGKESERNFFEEFLQECGTTHKSEVREIIGRIKVMAEDTGARDQFFKKHEGSPGDGVCALYDDEIHTLRLYCIKYGMDIIIVGGGGIKDVRAWQNDDRLKDAAELLIRLSKVITEKIKVKEIYHSTDRLSLLGDTEELEI